MESGNTDAMRPYAVRAIDRQFEFWQRDPMPIWIYSKAVALQKLDCLHRNATTERWHLAVEPADYYYLPATYYATGQDAFGFLKNLYEEPLR
jgi:hypothetical protein